MPTMFIASSAIRLPVHCEKLDDVDSRYPMRNRVRTRYYRTYVHSWAPRSPLNWDTMSLLDSVRPSVHTARFHDTKQMKSLP